VLLQDRVVATLGGQVGDIISGTVFVFVGLATCVIAAMRRRSGVRVLIWLGIWSAMVGARPLFHSLKVIGLLPYWIDVSLPFVDVVTSYLILVVGLLAWRELSLGKMRLLLQSAALIALAIALAGIAFFCIGASNELMPYNNFLATCTSAVLVTVVAVPKLAHKFLATPDSKVLLGGTLFFATQALYTNVLGSLGHTAPAIWGTLGFATLLFSFGYVALQMVFANEQRLLSIEKELAIAREIQNSILPSSRPELKSLRITATYRPMAAVAGDFYDFIPIDQDRIGFLIADVTGHGVPAALIASMIKVAMQSAVPCAHDPRGVLCELNRILFRQIHDQLVSAAYLWVDTKNRKALYSAAGHPPLLRWGGGKLERIESNGLLFGVIPDPDYPVCDLQIRSGDRFLLYTDGVIEPQNASGDSFGERKLEEVIRNNQSRPPSELADQVLLEIGLWQSASLPQQQDDITLIVIDVI
jgi:phosphoserine phosphatase RsbU/P